MALFSAGGRICALNPEAATGSQLLVCPRQSFAAFWPVLGGKPPPDRLSLLGGLPRIRNLRVFLFLSPLFPARAFKLRLLAALPLS